MDDSHTGVTPVELYLNHARALLQDQQDTLNGLHSRAAGSTTMAIALAGVVGVLLKDFSGTTQGSASMEPLVIIVVSVASISFLVTVILSMLVLGTRQNWHLGPGTKTFMENASHPDTDPTRWTADSIAAAVEANRCILDKKGVVLNRANISLIVMGLMTIITGALVV